MEEALVTAAADIAATLVPILAPYVRCGRPATGHLPRANFREAERLAPNCWFGRPPS